MDNKITKNIVSLVLCASVCIGSALLTSCNDGTSDTNTTNTEATTEATTGKTTDLVDDVSDENVDELLVDSVLYKVLSAAGVKRKDVVDLKVGTYQIVNGDVYYLNDGICKNTDTTPIFHENSYITSFHVSGKYIFYTIVAKNDKANLYCYNTETDEKTIVCSDEIYHYDVCDGKLLYLSIPQNNVVKANIFDPEENKDEFVCTIPEGINWIGDIIYSSSEMAFITDERCAIGKVHVLDIESKNTRSVFSSTIKGRFSITGADEGYYVSFHHTKLDDNKNLIDLDSKYNGVWYVQVSQDPKRISKSTYDELYFVNGKLVGVSEDTIEAIDTDPSESEKFPDSRTEFYDEVHKEIGSKVNNALDELFDSTVEANGGVLPEYLDPDHIASLTVRNYEAVQRRTLTYDNKCSQVIEKTLKDNLPEKCIVSHIPSWEVENGLIAEDSDFMYYVLDESLIPDDVDREELALYLEYRYNQDRRKSHDYSQYYDIDVKALETKYGNLGTVAVYKLGSWEYWNTATGDQKALEGYSNYTEISELYFNFMMND